MPAILIEVRKDYNEEEGTKIIDAVHSAMVTAFQIPPEDRTIRLIRNSSSRRTNISFLYLPSALVFHRLTF